MIAPAWSAVSEHITPTTAEESVQFPSNTRSCPASHFPAYSKSIPNPSSFPTIITLTALSFQLCPKFTSLTEHVLETRGDSFQVKAPASLHLILSMGGRTSSYSTLACELSVCDMNTHTRPQAQRWTNTWRCGGAWSQAENTHTHRFNTFIPIQHLTQNRFLCVIWFQK